MIETSDDRKNWTVVFDQKDGKGGNETLRLAKSATARFVRLRGLKRSNQYGYSIWEIEFKNSQAK